VEGLVFLVDVGILRICVKSDGEGVQELAPLLGVRNHSDASVAVFKIKKEYGKPEEVFMKVYPSYSRN
jgi:hypothetical protein